MLFFDFDKQRELRRILSIDEKRQKVFSMAEEKGIVLDATTKDFLEYYFFKKSTEVLDDGDGIRVHTVENNCEEDIYIKSDGGFCYSGWENSFFF